MIGRCAWVVGLIAALWGASAEAEPGSVTSSIAVTSTAAAVASPSITAPIFEKGTPLEWRWVEFDTGDWVVTGVAAALAVSGLVLRGSDAKLQGGVLFDEGVRDAISLPGRHQREAARDASDVILSLMTSYPFLVDSLIITYWHRQSGKAAWQMALIDAQAIAINAAVQGVTSALTARERPYGRTCGNELPAETRDCENFNRNTSFFSGHTSLAFTIAGLVCTNHGQLAINGDPVSDFVPCIGTLAAASAVGTLRILGDMHYLSDVLVGAAVGSLIGFGVPWLFHYRSEIAEASNVTVSIVPSPNGAALVGTF